MLEQKQWFKSWECRLLPSHKIGVHPLALELWIQISTVWKTPEFGVSFSPSEERTVEISDWDKIIWQLYVFHSYLLRPCICTSYKHTHTQTHTHTNIHTHKHAQTAGVRFSAHFLTHSYVRVMCRIHIHTYASCASDAFTCMITCAMTLGML